MCLNNECINFFMHFHLALCPQINQPLFSSCISMTGLMNERYSEGPFDGLKYIMNLEFLSSNFCRINFI